MAKSKTIRIGVFGCWRGHAYIRSLVNGKIPGCRITALCDKKQDRIQSCLEDLPKGRLAPKVFSDPEEFFDSKLFDAVFLINYFNEHAKWAVKALEKNIHVFSETMAASTMADAVALCRAAEKSKAIYMMAENYPHSKGNLELKKVYESGTLGKVLFAEGEYVHPMSPNESRRYRDPSVQGPYHWRRFNPITYYCSHALAPLMYMTGEMPKRVVGMCAYTPEEVRQIYHSKKAESVGVMLITTDGDAVFRVNGSSSMGPHGNWYRLACTKGGAETIRGNQRKVRVAYNSWNKPEDWEESEKTYEAEWPSDAEIADAAGHGGGDYWVVRKFIESIRGENTPFPNVYQACAMSAVGILGWRSILNGNIPYDIPDFSNEEERKKWQDDRQFPYPSEDAPNNIPFTSRPVTDAGDWN